MTNSKDQLSKDELERYKRHITLESIGIDGQIKLKNSSIIFIGAGGIGSPAILYSAAAGIGKIGIIDNDQVDKSNLQRQIIHDTLGIGENKTNSAKRRVNELNPNCEVKTFSERLSSKNALEIFQDFDIVCDCSDNFGTRFLINDTCILLGKPFIFGSVQGFEGHISVFNLNEKSPNLRDLITEAPKNDDIPSCSEFGVMGVSTGLIGILQVNEIIKIITKKEHILDGKILIFNLLTTEMKKLTLKADPKNKNISNLAMHTKDYENTECLENLKINTIEVSEFKKIYSNNASSIIIFDVREKDEFNQFSIKGSISIPLSTLLNKSSFDLIKAKYNEKKIYTLCQKGLRSEQASRILLEQNINSISIRGGLEQFLEFKLPK